MKSISHSVTLKRVDPDKSTQASCHIIDCGTIAIDPETGAGSLLLLAAPYLASAHGMAVMTPHSAGERLDDGSLKVKCMVDPS